jgi:FixJ family two-component response regulator
MASASELLEQVNTAISNCLTAQSYSVPGRQKVMAQLSQLRELRRELIDEIANGSNGDGSMAILLKMEGPTL